MNRQLWVKRSVKFGLKRSRMWEFRRSVMLVVEARNVSVHQYYFYFYSTHHFLLLPPSLIIKINYRMMAMRAKRLRDVIAPGRQGKPRNLLHLHRRRRRGQTKNLRNRLSPMHKRQRDQKRPPLSHLNRLRLRQGLIYPSS